MALLFGVCFFLYLLKLSAGSAFCMDTLSNFRLALLNQDITEYGCRYCICQYTF